MEYQDNIEIYEYSNYGTQSVIYSREYSTSSETVENSIPVLIKGITPTNVRIKLVDEDNDYIKDVNARIGYYKYLEYLGK